jgi:hypothetical protein
VEGAVRGGREGGDKGRRVDGLQAARGSSRKWGWRGGRRIGGGEVEPAVVEAEVEARRRGRRGEAELFGESEWSAGRGKVEQGRRVREVSE